MDPRTISRCSGSLFGLAASDQGEFGHDGVGGRRHDLKTSGHSVKSNRLCDELDPASHPSGGRDIFGSNPRRDRPLLDPGVPATPSHHSSVPQGLPEALVREGDWYLFLSLFLNLFILIFMASPSKRRLSFSWQVTRRRLCNVGLRLKRLWPGSTSLFGSMEKPSVQRCLTVKLSFSIGPLLSKRCRSFVLLILLFLFKWTYLTF